VDIGAGLYRRDVVVKKFMFAISSPDEFLFKMAAATILDFQNVGILWVEWVKRVEKRHHVKFCIYQSNCC